MQVRSLSGWNPRACRVESLAVLAFSICFSAHAGETTPPRNELNGGRVFLGYLPDGRYRLRDGHGTPITRPLAIEAMPRLGLYGFRRYMSPGYMGIARSESDAAYYHGPLQDAAEAAGMRMVPGFWLHHILDNVWGTPEELGVGGPEPDLHHPRNPDGLLDPRFWQEVVIRSRNLARGARSNQVFIDAEFVFWQEQMHAVWTDANLAQMRTMLTAAVAELNLENIGLVMYHPFLNASTPEVERIAIRLFAPTGPTDPLNTVEHFAPSPWFRIANWRLPEPWETERTYTQRGFFFDQVNCGFISSHALNGYTPRQYDTYVFARPHNRERTWYFCTVSTILAHSLDFLLLAGREHPTGDMNADGVWNSDDLYLFMDAVARQSRIPSELAEADFNDDGVVNNDDRAGFTNCMMEY